MQVPKAPQEKKTGKLTFMPKTYTHPASDYEIDSDSLLKILYMVNDHQGKLIGEAYSNPNAEADEGDEETGPTFKWNDQ